eukprot:m.18227 g.18227  ORF g.18227 m.18227 type:complete len:971 (-) comp3654_c0_seq1:216-3128(-)
MAQTLSLRRRGRGEGTETKGHLLAKRTFKKPTYCGFCGDLLWGLSSQGLCCELCGLVTHEKCSSLLSSICIARLVEEIEEPVGHQWIKQRNKKKYYCNFCRHHLPHGDVLVCKVCGCWSHVSCGAGAFDNCRATATFSPGMTPAEPRHWWIEGNLTSKAQCCVCNKACASTHCLFGLRCAWCSDTVHPACLPLVVGPCSFGPLASLMLPATAVSMGMSSANTNQLDDEDEVVDAEYLAILQGEGFREFYIYEGSVQMNDKHRRRIYVQDNMSVAVILELALTAYHIVDSADQYYLQEAIIDYTTPVPGSLRDVPDGFHGWKCENCSFCNDLFRLDCELCGDANPERLNVDGVVVRDVDPSERVSSLLEKLDASAQAGTKLQYYLKSHVADREAEEKRATIRVFSGSELRAAAAFKTFSITTETVAEVVEKAKEKFGLTVDSSELLLQEMQLNNGVRRRNLLPTESMFKVKQAFSSRSVNDGLVRFCLRTKAVAGERPSSLFVSNLPSFKEEDLESRLMSLIGDIAGCKVSFVSAQYGCAVLTYPSPEIAEQQASVLRLSTVGNCQLAVTFLPEILPDQIPKSSLPLLVFVNAKSGGGQGKELWARLSSMLNPHQVFDVTKLGPLVGICAFRNVKNFRVLVAGGDGTIGWVLNCLNDVRDKLAFADPHVCPLPVGTGNDLSRVLGWGPGYAGEKLLPILLDSIIARPMAFDRWDVHCESVDGDADKLMAMNNYFGLGIDAQIALDFHLGREAKPHKYSSRAKNKTQYVMKGVDALVKRPCKDIASVITLFGDGQPIKLPDLQGLIVLNINSFSAGADPWGTDASDSQPQAFDDGLVEVVGVFGAFHLSNISARLRGGKRIGQFRELTIHLSAQVPVQVDGEPWKQPAGTITIRRKPQQAIMLQHPKKALSLGRKRTTTILRKKKKPVLQRSDSAPDLTVTDEHGNPIEPETATRTIRSGSASASPTNSEGF